MKPELRLSLTGNLLVLEVLQASARIERRGSITAATLHAQLEQAFEALTTNHALALKGAELKVQLGLSHARLGLMVVTDSAANSLTSGVCESYSHAWVKQMLHLDPAGQVIRWELLDASRKLLISCIDRGIFEALKLFAAKHGLRFVSCRSAALASVAEERQQPAAADLTVVLTEPGGIDDRRSACVQIFRLSGMQIAASWRGWLPPSSGVNGQDESLEGAIRRFQARYSAQPGDAFTRLHWPSVTASL